MSFIDSIKTCFSKIFTFSGRARRSEFWYFYLFTVIVSFAAGMIFEEQNAMTYAVSLLIWLASWTVSVRRLHDIGKSGWWLLLEVIPLIGWIMLLIFFCTDSKKGTNKYGPNPKEEYCFE